MYIIDPTTILDQIEDNQKYKSSHKIVLYQFLSKATILQYCLPFQPNKKTPLELALVTQICNKNSKTFVVTYLYLPTTILHLPITISHYKSCKHTLSKITNPT